MRRQSIRCPWKGGKLPVKPMTASSGSCMISCLDNRGIKRSCSPSLTSRPSCPVFEILRRLHVSRSVVDLAVHIVPQHLCPGPAIDDFELGKRLHVHLEIDP